MVGRAPQGLLGRHVGEGAEEAAGARLEAVLPRAVLVVLAGARQALGEAEVEHLHAAARIDHQVGGLDVAVDHAAGVRLVERVGHLRGEVHGLAHRQGAGREQRRQRLAGHQFHHEEDPPVHLADVVDRGDARGPQRRGRPRLAHEARALLGVGGQLLAQELQGHFPSEPHVLGTEHGAHAPGAEGTDDAVVEDVAAGLHAWRVRVRGP